MCQGEPGFKGMGNDRGMWQDTFSQNGAIQREQDSIEHGFSSGNQTCAAEGQQSGIVQSRSGAAFASKYINEEKGNKCSTHGGKRGR
jgi:hypothetical protein